MGPEPAAATERADGPGVVDQVAAAREWLHARGIDAGSAPETGAGTARATPSGPSTTTTTGTITATSTGRAPAPPKSGTGGRRRSRSGQRGAGPGAWGGRRDDEVDLATAREDDGGTGGSTRSEDAPEGVCLGHPDADPEERARTIVLRKLAAQARTRTELERVLKRKAVPEEAAEAVLDRMGDVGLIDDAAFARDWVASRQQRRHLSRTALRRELQTKGVDRDVIDDALEVVDGADEHRAALDLAGRRAATMSGLTREVAYRRLGGVLARRGFSSSVTTRVLAEVLEDWPND